MDEWKTIAALTSGGQVKASAISPGGSLAPPASSSLARALAERMTFSEAIEVAGRIVDSYPNGGKAAGKSYLGALTAILQAYPRTVALQAAHPLGGVVAESEFLPAPATLIAWCEKHTAPMQTWHERDKRVSEQLAERAKFEEEQTTARAKRLSYAELKEKYGDWGDNWRKPGTKAAEQALEARRMLVDAIGQEAFDALPDGAVR